MTTNQKQTIEKAKEGLKQLPGILQSIGILNVRLNKCKPGTPGHKKLEQKHTELNNQASEIISIIRLVIEFAATAE